MALQLGWLDSNLFVHALYPNDGPHVRCRQILAMLSSGEAEGWIDPVIVHELTHVLPSTPQFRGRSRQAVLQYLLQLLGYDSVMAEDKPSLLASLNEWATEGGDYGDARLRVLARHHQLPVCSANERLFRTVHNTF
jgi:predicted nucleic acid-binding protein